MNADQDWDKLFATFVGPCQVVEFGNLKVITAADLENAGIDTKTRRLIFKTPNSKKWSPKFDPTFIGLSVDGAEWLVKRKIILIGNDYLSVQPYKGDDNVHRVLLGNGVAVLEGLNLENAKAGFYELLCLPLLIPSVEAAPARALLKPLKEI
jgi:arylformamidase